MSVLVHGCRRCGHQQAWHESGNGGYTPCRCCRAGTSDPDPAPTLLPTWSSPDGIRERLWEPGSRRNAGTMHATTTCGCDACHAAFRAERVATDGASGGAAPSSQSGQARAAG
ncbi:hypothetical protein [Terracoccus sp. 273MFTsu3.1]|uniref:hypothetical protein n=1 Tax=Terracoccus sp. 273MFTsu3.1 TaxID=1172188 RepID=UPI00037F9753|nr:hypothetical protein [Terracoccus sp. 273MFTsu3.1]